LNLDEATAALHEVGLAFHNLGDIDQQAVAGSFSTGTHGSGRDLEHLASLLIGGRIVTGDGPVRGMVTPRYELEDAARNCPNRPLRRRYETPGLGVTSGPFVL
jgi:L-gulono-1,4-lactone dehydrogenase